MQYETTAAAQRGSESCEIIGELVLQTAKFGIKGVSQATQAIKKWNNYRPARYKPWIARCQKRFWLSRPKFNAAVMF